MDDVQSITGSSPRQEMEERQETNTTGPSKRTRKNSSDVWNHFKILRVENKIRTVKCNWCPYTYDSNPTDGTTNMGRHILKCPGLQSVEPRPVFEESVFREKLVTIVVKHLLPYSFVEYEAVRDLLEYLNPHVVTISRNTCKADTMKLHEKTKNIVKDALKSIPGNICLTSDIWTSLATEGYLSLTAHYVDENWILQKRVLNLHHIETPHTGRALAACLLELLREWGIDRKILTITLDNASNNDAMVDVLKDHFKLNGSLICDGKYLHVRCGAHVLNLIVKAGLKIIDESVTKIRDCVKYVRNGEHRKESFARCIVEASLSCTKKVIQDVPIRWNSTYLMLDCALHFRLAFEKLKNIDPNFKSCPLANEWAKVQQLCEFLKPFQLITTFFSGSDYPTANLYFHGVWKIECLLRQEKFSHDENIRNMATEMWEKFEKYWDCYSVILSFALILDPRFKLEYLEYCFSKIYKPPTNGIRVREVISKFKELFADYERRISLDMLSSPPGSQSQNDSDLFSDELDDFSEFEKERNSARRTLSEIDEYLGEKCLVSKQKINILAYWKDNSVRYPILAAMARDILSIPITTVASESTFSIGGRVINKFRNTLSSDGVEAIVCTRDWLYGLVEAARESGEEDGYVVDFAPIVARMMTCNVREGLVG